MNDATFEATVVAMRSFVVGLLVGAGIAPGG
jgi:hypothetical protein